MDEAQRRGWRATKLPGARWAVKRLVLVAIRKSERFNNQPNATPFATAIDD